MTDISTTPPYSSATSSSTPTAPQNYFPQQVGQKDAKSTGSGVDWNQWAILIVSMILTGVIGYFSSLMAVKDDIAKNREGISVAGEKISNIDSGMAELKTSVKAIEAINRNVVVLEVKIESLSRQLDKQSDQIEKNQQGITNKGSGR
jgi:hypothetical protein